MSEVDAVQPSQVLAINPGDVVVFRVPPDADVTALTTSACKFLEEHPGTSALLLPDGFSVVTLHYDMIAALRAWREAWGTQGESQIAKMSQAALLTEEALKHLENTDG